MGMLDTFWNRTLALVLGEKVDQQKLYNYFLVDLGLDLRQLEWNDCRYIIEKINEVGTNRNEKLLLLGYLIYDCARVNPDFVAIIDNPDSGFSSFLEDYKWNDEDGFVDKLIKFKDAIVVQAQRDISQLW